MSGENERNCLDNFPITYTIECELAADPGLAQSCLN